MMVFKPLLLKGLILWSYKWTCALMRWSQESPRSKKMFLIFVQALIYHHRHHHHLSFLLFNITSTLLSRRVFGYIMTFGYTKICNPSLLGFSIFPPFFNSSNAVCPSEFSHAPSNSLIQVCTSCSSSLVRHST